MIQHIEYIKDEELSNKMTHKVCRWVARKNRFPMTTAENNTELKYAMWISRKKFHNHTGKYPLFDSDIKISLEYGYNIFEMSSTDYAMTKRIDKICKAYKKNPNNYPASGTLEYAMLSRIRRLDDEFVYPSIIEGFKAHGCLDLITKTKREIFSNLTTQQICQTLKDKKQLCDEMKRAVDRRRTRQTPLYPSDIEIYKNNKMMNSLKPQSIIREEKSNSMCRRICAWIDRNERFPSRSGGRIEARYNRWIWAKNMSLIGAGTTVFYESDQKIAESYGIELFNAERENSI